MKKFYFLFFVCLLFCVNAATADTKTGSWDLTKLSDDWKASGNVKYFGQPYGFQKLNGTLTSKPIADFYTAGITEIKVGFKCLQNGGTTSKLTIYLVDKDGRAIGSGVEVTPVDERNAASRTTYQYATFTENLEGATGFMMKVTKFGKNILVNGAEYTVTYSSTEPSITTSISELSFGKVETSSSKPLNFTLSGQNLTADATLSITGTDKGSFSVDPASISQEGGTIAEKEVTVTYAPTAMGAHNATLQIKSGETIKEIALSGTCLPTYNVSWMVNGVSYTTGDPSTSVTSGECVTALPTEPAAIGSKKFVGWTNEQIAAAQPTAPAVLFTTPENAPAVTGDVTYYAVFATEAMGSSAWKRIKTLPDITDGSYVIKNADYILPNTNTNSSKVPNVVAAPAISGETITGEVKASMIWSFTTTGTANQFYVQNANGSYLYENKANDGIRVGSTSDKWTFAMNTKDYFSMKGAKNNRYCAVYSDGKDWRSYLFANHENYANGGKLELYKLTIEKSYSDYCTTLPDVQLSVGKTGYATLYYSNFDLVVPENTEAYTFRSENGALMESVRYDEGEVIPAGEAVVVYTINDVPCTLNFRKFIANVARDASSQLAGTDEEVLIAQDDACYFYGLSLNSGNDINSVGFYWMVDGGAAFTNGAHKAYLKIPTSEFEGAQPVRGFAFKGTTTGVESVESSNNAPQAIYDLTGRRVSKAEKGIYIINGKKVIK